MTKERLFFSAAADAVDREAGVLSGVSMITSGPVLGHDVYADLTTLESVMACASQYDGGLKVKFEHGTGAKDIVGVLNKYRIEGDRLRADLHLLKASPHYEHLIEMAERIPESFGLSIAFSGDFETIELGDQKVQVEAMRCKEIYSCDIVDAPAANPNGLFHAPPKKRRLARKRYQDGNGNGGPSTIESDIADIDDKLDRLIDAIESLPDEISNLIDQMSARMADADLLSLRRLGTLGVPAGSVPFSRKPAEPPAKTLSQQLEAIPADNIMARRAFMAKHKTELYAEVMARK